MPSKNQLLRKLRRRQARIEASGAQELRFEAVGTLEIQAADGKLPTVELLAYTGGPLRLPNFPHQVFIDLAGVKPASKEQLPILRDHNYAKPLGHGGTEITAAGLKHSGPLSHEGAERDAVIKAANNGFKWQASVGGSVPNRQANIDNLAFGQKATVNGREVSGPAHVVRAFLWKETSVVSVGADEGHATASIAAAHSSKRYVLMNAFEKWLAANGIEADKLTDGQVVNLQAAFDALQQKPPESQSKTKKRKAVTVNAGGTGGNDDDGDDDNSDSLTAAWQNLQLRQMRIDSIFANYSGNMKPEEVVKLKEDVITGKISEDRAQLTLLQAARVTPQGGGSAMYDKPTTPLVIEAAICRTLGIAEDLIAAGFEGEQPKEIVDQIMNESAASRYKGFGIRATIRAACIQAGHSSFNGEIGNDEIRAAYQHAQRTEINAAGGGTAFSTISVPGILGGVARRAMLASYAETDRAGIILQIASATSTSDFKKFSRYRMTESGTMEIVPPSGEVKHGRVLEQEFENQVRTYGRLFGLTRHMQINDDLGAFAQIPRMLGRMGRHSLEEIGVKTLVDAAEVVGAGTDEFFHTAVRPATKEQPNYAVGADTALSVDSLGTAYQMFLAQTDVSGKPIMVNPTILLVSPKNAVMAQKLFNDAQYSYTDGTTRELLNNQWKGMFRVVVSAYLGTLGDPERWYLLGEPTEDFGLIQVAFLNGNRKPIIEQGVMDLNVLGTTYRGIFDFGFAMMDPRAGVEMKGEA